MRHHLSIAGPRDHCGCLNFARNCGLRIRHGGTSRVPNLAPRLRFY
jgi:hypothetical protein